MVGGGRSGYQFQLCPSFILRLWGKTRLLFQDSVSPSVKWGIKEVKHSKKVLSNVSVLITGSKWL